MATNKEWAMKMIPVLIRWAQSSWDKPHYYSNLSRAVGHKTNQIGKVMGQIQDIIDNLKKETGLDIPTLNGLAQSMTNDLPSDGFDYVIPNYSKLSLPSKKGEVRRLNEIAHKYDWSKVFKLLNLKPALILNEEEVKQLKKAKAGFGGGEGEEHKKLKEYIKNHPESINLKKVLKTENEYDLPSGDRLDVYLESKGNVHHAIEVKPKSSNEDDILRGFFQCIKYKAVMDASRVLDGGNYDNDVLLVVAGVLSEKAKQIANDLSIPYIENFQIK